MPLKLNVGASKKVGESNFGSRGASINVEMELESALVNDPPRLQERIRQLFDLVHTSLDEELKGNGNQSSPPPANAGQPQRNGGTGNGSSSQGNPPRPATQSQVKAIFAISRSKQVNLTKLLHDRFHVAKPDDLSIKEASQLIDELKNGNGQGGG